MKLERIATLLTEAEADKIHIPDDLPLVRQALTDAGRDRYVGYLEEALSKAKDYTDAGELIQAEYKRWKDIINYAIEEAFNSGVQSPYFLQHKAGEIPEPQRSDLYYGMNPMVHSIGGKLKKAKAAMKKANHEGIQVYIDMLEEVLPLADLNKKLKGMIVKKKSATVAKEKEVSETKAKQLSHTDVQKIRKVLIELTDELRGSVLQSNINYFNGLVQNWARQYNPRDRKTQNYNYNAQNPYARDIVRKAQVQKGSFHDTEELKADYSQDMHVAAKEVTDNVLNRFIEKNTSKLAEILSNKGDLKQVDLKQATAGRGVVEGWMTLTFNSGASFNVNNKVVWSYSKYGTPFTRFPTTFHKVKLSDGSYLNSPSEAKMKKEFK